MQNNTWPNYSSKEIKNVVNVIKSGKVNYVNGNIGKKFEYLFSKWVKRKYSVALTNGTVALELAIKSLKLPKNSEIMVTARSFFSSASTIVRSGYIPRFIDVDLFTQNILVEDILKKLNSKTKAIICVHLAGNPCEMKKIVRVAKKHKLKIIEDCAQAHGAEIDKKKVGSFSDVATWSFCNDKIISTLGEGGMISTNNKKIYDYINSHKDHGLSFNKTKNKKHQFIYNKDFFGSNFRLTEVQSSVGINQLMNIKQNLKKRQYIAEEYKKIFNKFNGFLYFYKPKLNIKPAWYRFYIFLKRDIKNYKKLRNIIVRELRKKKLFVILDLAQKFIWRKHLKILNLN